MSLKYKVIARKNPNKPEEPAKYYPSVQTSGTVTLRQLAEKAADISTLSPVDVMAAAELLLQLIPQELAQGNRVELGDFGTFGLRTRTAGSVEEKAVTTRNITEAGILFRPGKEAKKGLVGLKFEKLA